MGFEVINKKKKEKGLTNMQLSVLSGITLSTIDKITAGINTNPKLDTLQALCKVLDCSLDDFDDTNKKNNLPDLNDFECQLIANAKQLTPAGQQKLLEYSDDLVASKKYEKEETLKTIKVAARGGKFEEKTFTNEELKKLKDRLDSLPDVEDL